MSRAGGIDRHVERAGRRTPGRLGVDPGGFFRRHRHLPALPVASRSRLSCSAAVTHTVTTWQPDAASRSANIQSLFHPPVASTDTRR